MLHWIKNGTRILAGIVFFIILATVLSTTEDGSLAGILQATAIAAGGAILFWFAGFVICDIIVKGLVTHIDDIGVDALIDGGILQRVGMMQDELVPGGSEMPFTTIEITGRKQPAGKDRKSAGR